MVFIGHSFGGTIIAQVGLVFLVRLHADCPGAFKAKEDEQAHQALFSSTLAITFSPAPRV